MKKFFMLAALISVITSIHAMDNQHLDEIIPYESSTKSEKYGKMVSNFTKDRLLRAYYFECENHQLRRLEKNSECQWPASEQEQEYDRISFERYLILTQEMKDRGLSQHLRFK